jgi:hypothetical protein
MDERTDCKRRRPGYCMAKCGARRSCRPIIMPKTASLLIQNSLTYLLRVLSLLEQEYACDDPGAEERRTGGSHESVQAVRPPTRSVDITVHRPAGRGSSIAGCTGSLDVGTLTPFPSSLEL